MNEERPLKILVHISEEKDLLRGIGNIKNLILDVGDEKKGSIIFIINGPAAKVLLDESAIAEMKKLADKGIYFMTCRNSLKNLCADGICIKESSLPPFMEVLPAAITCIIKLQNNGFAYLKP